MECSSLALFNLRTFFFLGCLQNPCRKENVSVIKTNSSIYNYFRSVCVNLTTFVIRNITERIIQLFEVSLLGQLCIHLNFLSCNTISHSLWKFLVFDNLLNKLLS